MASLKGELFIKVIESIVLDEVPSASGIAKQGNQYYLIGDNAPFLFVLDHEFKLISKAPVYPEAGSLDGTFLKQDKPDFEALELVGENELIAFGSGSKSPQRDICLSISLDKIPLVKKYNIAPFYDSLRRLEILEGYELNIEAVALQNDRIHLFNRGRNVVFSFPYEDLIAHFEDDAPFPPPKTTLFELPKLNGIEAGFSGATAFQDKPYIIFTASVEDTDNAYDDGEVLGSFIGIIDLENDAVSKDYKSVFIPNQVVPLKVESVAIDTEISEREFSLVLVTDSDGGKSKLISCLLSIR